MSFNWNNAALQVVTTGLGEIPVVGSILSALASIFWPQSQVDVWSEIKDQVQQLIDQEISQDTYDRVQAMLGSAEQGTGLIGVINNYLGSVSADNNNGQDSTRSNSRLRCGTSFSPTRSTIRLPS